MNWLRPLLPNRISGQIAILIAISLIVFHLVLTAWFFLDHHDHRRSGLVNSRAAQRHSSVALIEIDRSVMTMGLGGRGDGGAARRAVSD